MFIIHLPSVSIRHAEFISASIKLTKILKQVQNDGEVNCAKIGVSWFLKSEFISPNY